MDSKKKIITRAERQQKMQVRNQRLDNHINKGVERFVQDTYNDRKEARKNYRWAETGEALKDAALRADHDADAEFLTELEEASEAYYLQMDSELEAMELKVIEAEDDVIEVEYKELPSFGRRTPRVSKLTGSNSLRGLSSSQGNALPASTPKKSKSKFDVGEMPK